MTEVGAQANGAAAAAVVPRLAFAVEGARAVEQSVTPAIAFGLRIDSLDGRAIRSLLLDVQLRIVATERGYDGGEEERLVELFGAPERWGASLHSLLWTRATLVVPPFERTTAVELTVACSYDFEVAASKYLDALRGGEVPLELLFSGTAFHADDEGRVRAARLSWESEARFRMPVAVWRGAMDRHFPNSTWLRLDRAAFERLRAYRSRQALPSWEAAIDALLAGRGEAPR